MTYVKPDVFSLRSDPTLSESWVQERIAEDPSILGIGDLDLRDKERRQPRAGRLDFLLQDSDSKRRYEVEIQLGATDERHIIRTLEYWDIEKKRYPQYEHCAVIVAEEITARFLNVISLFNGFVPLIAVQMTAFRMGDSVSLLFTKVLDEMSLGLVDEDEDALAAPTDRIYWEGRSTRAMVQLADEILGLLRDLDPSLALNYNKHYIGLFRDGQPFNFLVFRPRKSRINLDAKLPRSDEIDDLIEASGLDTLEYNSRWMNYRLSLKPEDLTQQEDALKELFRRSYQRRVS